MGRRSDGHFSYRLVNIMTLIAVYNSDGCVGRCDAKCYEAQELDCHCICGGRNHGAGQTKAVENTRDMAKDMLEEWQKTHPDTVLSKVAGEILQRELF